MIMHGNSEPNYCVPPLPLYPAIRTAVNHPWWAIWTNEFCHINLRHTDVVPHSYTKGKNPCQWSTPWGKFVSSTIPIQKSSNLSCAESAQKMACHLFKIFLSFSCLGWKLLRRFMNSIFLLVTDRNLFNRFHVSGRLRIVLICDGLFILAHERRQKCVEFGTANKS